MKPNIDYKRRFKTDAPLHINDLPPAGFSFSSQNSV